MTTPPASSSAIDAAARGVEEIIEISTHEDVIYARSRARFIAGDMGFPVKEQWEIAISVSEAASNVVKYAGRGKLTISPIVKDDKPGIEFRFEDMGPGIEDIENALRDGFSEGRDLSRELVHYGLNGLGSGIPAIARLMDELRINSRQSGGTCLVTVKYL